MEISGIMILIFDTFLLIFPAYVSNSAAIVFGGWKPIDFGRKWSDGRRIFGDGKTFSGGFFGVLAGFLVALALNFANPVRPVSEAAVIGLLMCSGAIFGDIAGSFIKRRTNIKSGEPVFILDQLDFIAGAIAFTLPLHLLGFGQIWSITIIATAVIMTPPIHIATNMIAFKLKLKKVPW